ncbi:Dihydrolipoyl dehydrogenase [uncultured archaeon]|nr:Dihydrolipoyl dehydrogenase [uncultured archaeon]
MVMGDLATCCDVLVVGAGFGGYVAAIRAAQLGKDVLLVDRGGERGLGGTCLNNGCIPSKALIYAAGIAHGARNAGEMGIDAGALSVDMAKMQAWKQGVIDKLRLGVEMLCKRHGVQIAQGEAFFKSSGSAGIRNEKGVGTVEFGHAIIASGVTHMQHPKMPFDGSNVLNSAQALKLSEIPRELLVVGGGYIALEMGTLFAKLGSKVKIVHRSERILRGMDDEVADVVLKKLPALGIELMLNSEVDGFEEGADGRLAVSVREKGREAGKVAADKILVAIGNVATTAGLGLENTQMQLDENGFVKVDEKMRTHDHKIFAVGDCVGAPMLAHKASRQGKIAAEVIAGLESSFSNKVIPAVVFCEPEVASAGLGEEDAMTLGKEVVVGKFPFRALGRALTMDSGEGFVKIVAEKNSGLVLGVHIVGPDAGELISEAALAIEMGAVLEDLAFTIHPHPTLPEALNEAAEAALGKAIHIFQGELKK